MENIFDLNQELSEISLDGHVFTEEIDGFLIDGFYHCHRLGSRVPLFLFGHVLKDLEESFAGNRETITYFSKIGNILVYNFSSLHLNLRTSLGFMLKKFGSFYTVVFCLDLVAASLLTQTILGSPFFQSEIKAYVVIHEKSVSFHSAEISLIIDSSSESIQLRNAKILQFLQATFNDRCLDWNWQFEQSDKLFIQNQLVLKNLDKWKATDSSGSLVEGTPFIPMKLMHDGDACHNPYVVLQKYQDIGMVVDLSNDEGSYDKSPLFENNILYRRIQLASKIVPSSQDISYFIDLTSSFISKNPTKKIIVHCHYGFNRTGLMICAFLISKLKISVSEAIRRFKIARPPGIKHQNYIDKLYLRYENKKEKNEMYLEGKS
jgi:protein-tyrosine phosphatase